MGQAAGTTLLIVLSSYLLSTLVDTIVDHMSAYPPPLEVSLILNAVVSSAISPLAALMLVELYSRLAQYGPLSLAGTQQPAYGLAASAPAMGSGAWVPVPGMGAAQAAPAMTAAPAMQGMPAMAAYAAAPAPAVQAYGAPVAPAAYPPPAQAVPQPYGAAPAYGQQPYGAPPAYPAPPAYQQPGYGQPAPAPAAYAPPAPQTYGAPATPAPQAYGVPAQHAPQAYAAPASRPTRPQRRPRPRHTAHRSVSRRPRRSPRLRRRSARTAWPLPAWANPAMTAASPPAPTPSRDPADLNGIDAVIQAGRTLAACARLLLPWVLALEAIKVVVLLALVGAFGEEDGGTLAGLTSGSCWRRSPAVVPACARRRRWRPTARRPGAVAAHGPGSSPVPPVILIPRFAAWLTSGIGFFALISVVALLITGPALIERRPVDQAIRATWELPKQVERSWLWVVAAFVFVSFSLELIPALADSAVGRKAELSIWISAESAFSTVLTPLWSLTVAFLYVQFRAAAARTETQASDPAAPHDPPVDDPALVPVPVGTSSTAVLRQTPGSTEPHSA